MTVEHGSSLDDEQAIDGTAIPRGDQDRRPTAIGRRIRRSLTRWRSITATTVVVAAVAVAAGVYFTLYRPDRQVDDAAAHGAIQAASDGAAAVLSYSYDHLNRDLSNAKPHLTGDFLAFYTKFADDVIAPAAQKGQLTATAKVVRAAVSEMHPDSAVVLVFVDQITASVHKKDPETTRSSVLVTLKKVNGSWLIAKFDPNG